MARVKRHSPSLRTFKPKARTLPQGSYEFQVHDLAVDGRGVAHRNHKVVFVAGALPEETVRGRYRQVKKDFDEVQADTILQASPHRTEPLCPHYARCGGCQLQHLDYPQQLVYKDRDLQKQFAALIAAHHTTIAAPLYDKPYQYRHRLRLAVSVEGHRLLLGFRQQQSHRVEPVAACTVAHSALSDELSHLSQLLGSLAARKSVSECLLAEDAGQQCHLRIITQRALSSADIARVHDYACARGLQLSLADTEQVYWANGDSSLLYKPDLQHQLTHDIADFTQVNPVLNRLMIEQARDWLALGSTDRLADFFCGVGNFAISMAASVERVLGFEVSSSMVEKASANAGLNRLNNAEFFCLDLQTLALGDKAINTNAFNTIAFNKAIIDPPRSGAWTLVQQLAQRELDSILYVSCNPATLLRDAQVLCEQGYRLERLGLVDLFPQTAHSEAMALFTKCKVYQGQTK